MWYNQPQQYIRGRMEQVRVCSPNGQLINNALQRIEMGFEYKGVITNKSLDIQYKITEN